MFDKTELMRNDSNVIIRCDVLRAMKAAPIMTRVDAETKRKLKALAEATDRSEAYLAREAIEAYVALNAWQVEEIARSLEELRAGAPTVAHEDVKAWVRSWDSPDERKKPTGRR